MLLPFQTCPIIIIILYTTVNILCSLKNCTYLRIREFYDFWKNYYLSRVCAYEGHYTHKNKGGSYFLCVIITICNTADITLIHVAHKYEYSILHPASNNFFLLLNACRVIAVIHCDYTMKIQLTKSNNNVALVFRSLVCDVVQSDSIVVVQQL